MELEFLVSLLPEHYSALLGFMKIGRVEVSLSQPALKKLISDFCDRLIWDNLTREGGMDAHKSELKEGVRNLLRKGGFKPAGRNRPANEFLLRQLLERGSFNFISNLVDINNFLSLKHYLPMSVLDEGKFARQLVVRLGGLRESYIFNPTGQEIDLEGLIVLADGDHESSVPLGSPVKDSLAGKITAETTSALVAVYSPASLVTEGMLEAILNEWEVLTANYAGGALYSTAVIRS